MVLKINGDIVDNELKDVYDWFGYEATCPADVENAIANLPEGDHIVAKINSGGGMVMAGQQIYSMLRSRDDVEIEVESFAGSAASIIAMAGHSTISPVGMLMIHDVSMETSGNKADMLKNAEILQTFDEALAAAYVEKTGMSREDVLALMDSETWITAKDAVEWGFIDAISEKPQAATASTGLKVTDDMLKQYKAAMAKRETEKQEILKDLDNFGAKGGNK